MICYFEYRKFAKRKLTSRGRISRVATRYRPISKFSWIPNGQQEIRLEMLADMLTELHFKQFPFFSWNYEYFCYFQMLLSYSVSALYIYKSIPSNQYIFYNRDNFLNFLYIQKLLKLLCFPPTSLQISRPFDSLPFIWFILFSLLRIFADNKSNTQIYQPGFTLNTKYLQVIMDAEQSHFSVFAGYYSRLKSEKNVFRLIQYKMCAYL